MPFFAKRDHTKPFVVQFRTRIGLALLILLLPVLLFTRPRWADNDVVLFLGNALGLLMIALGILGRLWCTLYIGGRKANELQRTGPYSIVRHPLYVGSLLMTMGFAVMTVNPLALIIMLAYFAVQYAVTIGFEEKVLAAKFGEDYRDFERTVPRFIPRLSGYNPNPPESVNMAQLAQEVRYALGYLCLIPVFWLVELLQHQQWLSKLVFQF
jgi:protein-S-isoprenylcysteine O-methyltransferase Ste14